MSQEIEIEYKNILTKAEYWNVYQFLSFESEELIEQTNYYFETDDLSLKKQGAALRIRKKNEQWTLTLKQPHPDGLLETHDQISEKEADLWIQNKGRTKPNTHKQLQSMGINKNQLRYLGSLTTRRKEKEYEGTTVVLDHSLYYDKEDYELEVEAPSKVKGEAVIQQILEACHIPERETDNKIKRFYNAKLKSD